MVYRKTIGAICSLLAVITLITPAATHAAPPVNSGNGLKISPVITNLTVNPGQTQTLTVYVQNVTSATVTLQAVVNDFTASSDESGVPALLLDPNQYATSHSLKRLVAPISNFTLQSNEQKTVNVVIAIPPNAPGGGYYGAIRFLPAAIGSGGNSNVTLSASVGSLILVKVPGSIKEDLELVSLDARKVDPNTGEVGAPQMLFVNGKNIVAAVRFQNKGDVQEQPFGKVALEQGNKVLATYEINSTTPRGNVLPDSVRKFTVPLDKVGTFGVYTLTGNFGYGNSGQLMSGKETFYVIPIMAIVIAILIIALILSLIFVFPKLIRSYNRRVVQKATHRR